MATGWEASRTAHIATLPTLKEVLFKAKREKRSIVERVLLADDTIATIKAGPRGGLKILAPF